MQSWYNQDMVTLTIDLDEVIAKDLRRISLDEGCEPAVTAARLLKRAVLRARPRPVYDVEAIKAAYSEFAAEDAALADEDSEEALRHLAAEDVA